MARAVEMKEGRSCPKDDQAKERASKTTAVEKFSFTHSHDYRYRGGRLGSSQIASVTTNTLRVTNVGAAPGTFGDFRFAGEREKLLFTLSPMTRSCTPDGDKIHLSDVSPPCEERNGNHHSHQKRENEENLSNRSSCGSKAGDEARSKADTCGSNSTLESPQFTEGEQDRSETHQVNDNGSETG
ncbi:hypothetical protein BGW80DRAFT_1256281 [Lactifluus volemus]|nr:hypothetical protein BGW80DRAFT_1256281 [Lactifluus volemus]